MKHLPKHLRPRWRYLAVGLESWPEASFGRGDFQRELWYAAQNLLGDPGSADADCTVVRFEFDDGVGEAVVRARHGHVTQARAAVACVESVSNHPVRGTVRGVSGTIRACEEKYLGRPTEFRDERRVVFEDAERPADVRDDSVDVRTADGFAGATTLDFD